MENYYAKLLYFLGLRAGFQILNVDRGNPDNVVLDEATMGGGRKALARVIEGRSSDALTFSDLYNHFWLLRAQSQMLEENPSNSLLLRNYTFKPSAFQTCTSSWMDSAQQTHFLLHISSRISMSITMRHCR